MVSSHQLSFITLYSFCANDVTPEFDPLIAKFRQNTTTILFVNWL